MLKEFVEYLIGLKKPQIIKAAGDREFMIAHEYQEVVLRTPDSFTVSTLDGFIGFIMADVDGWLKKHKLIVCVESPVVVSLYSETWYPQQSRARLLSAEARVPQPFWDRGEYVSAESFIVAAQSRLLPCDNRSKLLAVVGNIKEESVRMTSDDGVTQEVTLREGINRKTFANLPNPVALTPIRSFLEVEQVQSEFVFRAKDGPRFMLYEADGGAWKLDAMSIVASYIKDRFKSNEISIPVIF